MEDHASYVQELMKERDLIDPSLTHSLRTINKEIERLQSGGEINENGQHDDKSDKSSQMIEVSKPIKLRIKVCVPVKEHPNFNFVGKLLGPKGLSLKRLQEETMTKMAILGRGSMRDKAKEAEFREGSDPKYGHLNEELHVEIRAFAPAADAYARVANALDQVKKFFVPDYFDDIRTQQFEELAMMNGGRGGGRGGGSNRPPLKGGPPSGGRPHPGMSQGGQSQWVSLAGPQPQRTSTPRGRGSRGGPAGQFGARGGRGAIRGRGGPGMPPQGMGNQEYSFDMDTGYGNDHYDEHFGGPSGQNTSSDGYYDYNQGGGDNSYQGGNQGEYAQADYTEDWNPDSTNRMKPDQAGGPVRRGGMTRGSFRSQPYASPSYGGGASRY